MSSPASVRSAPTTPAADPAAAQAAALSDLIDHRCKALLAQVQAIAELSLRHAPSPQDFVDGFTARLQALSRAHELLGRAGWAEVDLRDVATDALAPFLGSGRRIRLDGPPMRLAPETAGAFHMAFHELGANAAIHGALAVDTGRVELVWRADLLSRVLRLTWREFGGPPPSAERRNGFGMRLLTTGVARGLGGESRIDFRPGGFLFGLTAPLSDGLACG